MVIKLDSTKNVNEYIKDVLEFVNNFRNTELKNYFKDNSKAQIIEHFLKKHSMIDSITITSSGHGISFYRIDNKSWSNIIVK